MPLRPTVGRFRRFSSHYGTLGFTTAPTPAATHLKRPCTERGHFRTRLLAGDLQKMYSAGTQYGPPLHGKKSKRPIVGRSATIASHCGTLPASCDPLWDACLRNYPAPAVSYPEASLCCTSPFSETPPSWGFTKNVFGPHPRWSAAAWQKPKRPIVGTAPQRLRHTVGRFHRFATHYGTLAFATTPAPAVSYPEASLCCTSSFSETPPSWDFTKNVFGRHPLWSAAAWQKIKASHSGTLRNGCVTLWDASTVSRPTTHCVNIG